MASTIGDFLDFNGKVVLITGRVEEQQLMSCPLRQLQPTLAQTRHPQTIEFP
jgi:hypothetical protein